jgi:thiamine kinase-like enzyme
MDDRKAVLKIDEQPRSEPFNSRPAEASIQSIAASQGLAGAVLHVDEQVLLCEFLEGQVWKPQHLERDENIELVATTLRRLHALPLTGRSFDSTVAAAHCTRVIESMRLPHKLCCCHNDLVAENIVTAPGMMFLDWEYACDNDPLFDLATVVEHHDLGEETAFRLLDAYFDGDGARWRPKLREQQDLYLALYWLS